MQPRRPVVLQATMTESDPGAKAAQHAGLLWKGQDGTMTPRAHDTEIASMTRPFVIGNLLDHSIKERVSHAQEEGRLAAAANAKTHAEILACSGFKKLHQYLHRILKVTVHYSDVVALSISEADGHGCLVPKVPAQP